MCLAWRTVLRKAQGVRRGGSYRCRVPSVSHIEADGIPRIVPFFPQIVRSIKSQIRKVGTGIKISSTSAHNLRNGQRPSFNPKDPSIQVPPQPSFRLSPRHGASHAPSFSPTVKSEVDICNILTLGYESMIKGRREISYRRTR